MSKAPGACTRIMLYYCAKTYSLNRGLISTDEANKRKTRHEKRKSRKRKECRAARKAGKKCRKNRLSRNFYPPLPEQDDLENLLLQSTQSPVAGRDDQQSETSYLNYYRQGAELLQLLSNRKKGRSSQRKQ